MTTVDVEDGLLEGVQARANQEEAGKSAHHRVRAAKGPAAPAAAARAGGPGELLHSPHGFLHGVRHSDSSILPCVESCRGVDMLVFGVVRELMTDGMGSSADGDVLYSLLGGELRYVGTMPSSSGLGGKTELLECVTWVPGRDD